MGFHLVKAAKMVTSRLVSSRGLQDKYQSEIGRNPMELQNP